MAASVASLAAMVSCSKSSNNNSGGGSSSADSVLYSNWTPLNLAIVGSASDSDYEQKLTVNALTASVLNKGMVNVYLNESGSGGTAINAAADIGVYPTFVTGAIYLDAYDYNGYVLSTNTFFDSVRYVIIPGRISTTNADGSITTYTPQQLKAMDYATITKLLGIPARGASLKGRSAWVFSRPASKRSPRTG